MQQESMFYLARAIRYAKKNPTQFTTLLSIPQKVMDDLLTVNSEVVFKFNSYFPRSSFKISMITSGRVEYEMKRLTFTGETLDRSLEELRIVKEFMNAMYKIYGDNLWVKNYR